MLFDRKGALQRLFLRPWIGPYVAKSQGWRCDECPWMGGIAQGARTAMRIHLCFFIALLTISSTAPATPLCPKPPHDENARIKYVVDGDTLHLKDGRKVRLIGINAPERAHGNKPAEPFSAEATHLLKRIFKNKPSLSLVYGKEKHDKYDRLLAHVFTTDGKNAQSILLRQGLARAITFPPNTRFASCYLQQERVARCNKTGLWKKNGPLLAKKLKDNDTGFQLVSGKLKDIRINKKGIWLNLDDKLTVGIRPENQPLFDINALYKMRGQKIVVRGWLNKNKKYSSHYIRIRHPSSIQIAEKFACDKSPSF